MGNSLHSNIIGTNTFEWHRFGNNICMRATLNYGIQLVIACLLLIGIKCNPYQPEVAKEKGITKSEQDFIVQLLQNTNQIIQLSEIGQMKGARHTASMATTIKDRQIAALYILKDYADRKNIQVPNHFKYDSVVQNLYLSENDFDSLWKVAISNKSQNMAFALTRFSAKANSEMKETIEELIVAVESGSGPKSDELIVVSN
jgi:hypothetical protein